MLFRSALSVLPPESGVPRSLGPGDLSVGVAESRIPRRLAGDAEKKARARRRRAQLTYGGVVAASVLLWAGCRFGHLRAAALVDGPWHAAALLLAAAAYGAPAFFLIEDAAAGRPASDAWTDLLAVAAVAHVGSVYSKWAWMFLLAFPVAAAAAAYRALRPAVAAGGARAAAARDADAVKAALHAAAEKVNAGAGAGRRVAGRRY